MELKKSVVPQKVKSCAQQTLKFFVLIFIAFGFDQQDEIHFCLKLDW
jgi:hypothetical protein